MSPRPREARPTDPTYCARRALRGHGPSRHRTARLGDPRSMTNPLRTLIALATALLLSASLAAGTLIGAFDVGPGGSPVPSGPWYNTAGNTWISKIWTPLVSLDATASGLAPQLATSWEANDDYTQWTFTLREGVEWHDGEPFTAADVAFTWHFVN